MKQKRKKFTLEVVGVMTSIVLLSMASCQQHPSNWPKRTATQIWQGKIVLTTPPPNSSFRWPATPISFCWESIKESSQYILTVKDISGNTMWEHVVDFATPATPTGLGATPTAYWFCEGYGTPTITPTPLPGHVHPTAEPTAKSLTPGRYQWGVMAKVSLGHIAFGGPWEFVITP